MSTKDNNVKKMPPRGTKEYAKKICELKELDRARTYCPLTRGSCIVSCSCYIRPVATIDVKSGESQWYCKGGYCSCYILTGPK